MVLRSGEGLHDRSSNVFGATYFQFSKQFSQVVAEVARLWISRSLMSNQPKSGEFGCKACLSSDGQGVTSFRGTRIWTGETPDMQGEIDSCLIKTAPRAIYTRCQLASLIRSASDAGLDIWFCGLLEKNEPLDQRPLVVVGVERSATTFTGQPTGRP